MRRSRGLLRWVRRAVVWLSCAAAAAGAYRSAVVRAVRRDALAREPELGFDPDLGWSALGQPVTLVSPGNDTTLFFLDGYRIQSAAGMHREWFEALHRKGVNVVAPVLGLSSGPFDFRNRSFDHREELRAALQLYDVHAATQAPPHRTVILAYSYGVVPALVIAQRRAPDEVVLVAPATAASVSPTWVPPLVRWLFARRWASRVLPYHYRFGGRGRGWDVHDSVSRGQANELCWNSRERNVGHIPELRRALTWCADELAPRVRGHQITAFVAACDRMVSRESSAKLLATLRAAGNDVDTYLVADSGHGIFLDVHGESVRDAIGRLVRGHDLMDPPDGGSGVLSWVDPSRWLVASASTIRPDPHGPLPGRAESPGDRSVGSSGCGGEVIADALQLSPTTSGRSRLV